MYLRDLNRKSCQTFDYTSFLKLLQELDVLESIILEQKQCMASISDSCEIIKRLTTPATETPDS